MKKHTLILLLACLLAYGASAQSQQAVHPFGLHEVELLPGPFYNAQQTDLRYILAMEPDRLLAPYLREAGLTPKAETYTNWESRGLDGHIGGHYLSALAMMYASLTPALSEGGKEVKSRLDYMIAELKRCQDAAGTGFLGGTPGSRKLWEEIKEGDIRASGFALNDKWVPLYNIHKTYAGLRDAYLFAGNRDALNMLVKMTDWMIGITGGLTDEQMQDMLRSEHGGLNEVFADVYDITGDSRYLELAKRFSHLFILEPLLSNEDKLTGLHANTQIPKVIGYKRIADLEKNTAWNNAAQFFWQTVTDHRSVSIGGNSVREHFHPADNFETMITEIEGPETCNTYNMLRLSNLFFQSTADTKYTDYYERALYNHILSSQEPERGGFVYFTPMRPGHYRVYSQPHTSMWCCVGSGLENHTKYGELIYAHNDDELYVNLFISSRLNWKEKAVVLKQETSFPDDNKVALTFEEAGKKALSLKIRIPGWAKGKKIEVSVNGKAQEAAPSGNYLTLNRKWKKGDTVELVVPMELRLEQLPDGTDYYSIAYGPIILATATGTNDLVGLLVDESRGGHVARGMQMSLLSAPTFVADRPEQILTNIRKENGSELLFTYSGKLYPQEGETIALRPFFRTHNTRYEVYFRQVTPENLQKIKEEIEYREKLSAALLARTIDFVHAGEQQPESDHLIKFEDSQTGNRDNRHYRSARGFFSYQMSVKGAENATALSITMHKKDRPAETRIFLNDTEITSTPVINDLDENFASYTYELPQALKEGTHTVKFMPGKDNSTARIYEVRIIK